MSTEKLTNFSKVQSEPHFPSDVVLGQLVPEWINLENGIVLPFSSQPHQGVSTQALLAHRAGSWSQHLQPHRGASTLGGGSPI